MTGSDNFFLHLNSFNENIKTTWKEIQVKEDFCDMTLACQDKQVKAHKLIISSYSPVLRHILNSTQNIHLRSVKYKTLQNLLTFMYQGEVDVAKEDLNIFLEVAEDLNIRGLSEGNMEGCNSTESNPSHVTPSDFKLSPERNINTERNENVRDQRSILSITEYENAD